MQNSPDNTPQPPYRPRAYTCIQNCMVEENISFQEHFSLSLLNLNKCQWLLILFYSRRCRKRDLRVDRAYTTWKTSLLWYQVMMLVAMLSSATNKFRSSIHNLIIIIKSLLMASHIYNRYFTAIQVFWNTVETWHWRGSLTQICVL